MPVSNHPNELVKRPGCFCWFFCFFFKAQLAFNTCCCSCCCHSNTIYTTLKTESFGGGGVNSSLKSFPSERLGLNWLFVWIEGEEKKKMCSNQINKKAIYHQEQRSKERNQTQLQNAHLGWRCTFEGWQISTGTKTLGLFFRGKNSFHQPR